MSYPQNQFRLLWLGIRIFEVDFEGRFGVAGEAAIWKIGPCIP
jgi:hypothetical protein